MIELLQQHLSEILIGIFTVIGAIVGVLVSIIYNYFKDRKDRKDRYFFSMITKRFEVYSEAFSWCEELKWLVHAEEKERYEKSREARKWYARNNLYLEPEIRFDFLDFIQQVELYKNKLEIYLTTGKENGFDSEDTKRIASELHANFEDIMAGIQKRIQEKIDPYYKNWQK